ncbi:uncharacterized protein LOC132295842 [Cornus florida]|uniref:uncharacterized protein LOC132295842 n=1 Tax=Cornus florida TaxID=4283 RepID=UPI0028981DBF|nr:uncharacterized protein LOC132295842 [Cornus florida]
MAVRNFWASYKISSLITSVHRYRLFAGNPSQSQHRDARFSNKELRGTVFRRAKWIFGSVLTFLLRFWQQKLKTLLRLEGKAEEVVEEVENVAEEIEKVATTTEKISAEVANKIPFNGKLKDAALCIEHVSSVTAKDAQQVLDLIHKVDELKHDLKDLETFVEPVIDKIKINEDEEK